MTISAQIARLTTRCSKQGILLVPWCWAKNTWFRHKPLPLVRCVGHAQPDQGVRGNVCLVHARRATFVLSIPAVAPSLSSPREVPQVDRTGPQTFPAEHVWAEWLHHPCLLGRPQWKGDQIRSGYINLGFLGADCLVRGGGGGQKQAWVGTGKKKMPGLLILPLGYLLKPTKKNGKPSLEGRDAGNAEVLHLGGVNNVETGHACVVQATVVESFSTAALWVKWCELQWQECHTRGKRSFKLHIGLQMRLLILTHSAKCSFQSALHHLPTMASAL